MPTVNRSLAVFAYPGLHFRIQAEHDKDYKNARKQVELKKLVNCQREVDKGQINTRSDF